MALLDHLSPRFATIFIGAAIMAVILVPEARGDIYRWVDEHGVTHFTDDASTIPDDQKGPAKVFIKEGPKRKEGPSPHAQQDISSPQSSAAEGPAGSREAEAEQLRLDIDQMKAKISAKESLIRAVDEKRSLLNPVGNRIVDKADMDLYEKYQSELPADRGRLQELENRFR